MEPQRFYWRDLQSGHITVTVFDRCPPGHVRSAGGPVRDGTTLRTSFNAMDAEPMNTLPEIPAHLKSAAARGVQAALGDGRSAGRATFDAAGPTRLSDGQFLSDAIAKCPASTRQIGFKAEQALLAAEGATPLTVENHTRALRDSAQSFGTHGHLALDEGAKAACKVASDALSGAAAALEALHRG